MSRTAATDPTAPLARLSDAVLEKMKQLSRKDDYIDDPEWTTFRGLALIEELEYLRSQVHDCPVCHIACKDCLCKERQVVGLEQEVQRLRQELERMQRHYLNY